MDAWSRLGTFQLARFALLLRGGLILAFLTFTPRLDHLLNLLLRRPTLRKVVLLAAMGLWVITVITLYFWLRGDAEGVTTFSEWENWVALLSAMTLVTFMRLGTLLVKDSRNKAAR